jgi:hypothetical protein
LTSLSEVCFERVKITSSVGDSVGDVIESPNVVVYGDDSVYDETSDKCVHAQ